MGRLSALVALVTACITLQLTPGHVAWVHDGDTFRLVTVRVWAGVGVVDQSIRLLGVDAYELTMKDETGATVPNPKGLEAKAFTSQWISAGPFTLKHCFKRDKYGRPLAEVTRVNDGLADALIAAGLGVRE